MMKTYRKSVMQLIMWLGLFAMFFNMSNYFQPIKLALISALFDSLSLFIVYKITVGYLFPRYYSNQRHYMLVSFGVLLILSAFYLFIEMNYVPRIVIKGRETPPLFFYFFRTLMVTSFTFFIATSVSLMEHTNKLHENEKMLKAEKLETELKLLKAQINPHFIFNALNNIYSLTYLQSKKAPESVLKLSEMLRYVFYDCSKDQVSLASEIRYIENFNSFQQMKSEYTQNITLQTDIYECNTEIAPMLFIPFIENAFKYSRIEEDENAYIAIQIMAKKDNVHFTIKNSLPKENLAMAGSGMGIKNVKHRLDIIYPQKHDLKIVEENDIYMVDLMINISDETRLTIRNSAL